MQRQQFLQAHIQSHQQSVESYFHAIKHQPAFASIRMLCSAFSYFAAANLLPFVFILFVEMKACCRLVQLLVSPVMVVTKMWIYWPGRAGSRWHQYIKHSYEFKKKETEKERKKKILPTQLECGGGGWNNQTLLQWRKTTKKKCAHVAFEFWCCAWTNWLLPLLFVVLFSNIMAEQERYLHIKNIFYVIALHFTAAFICCTVELFVGDAFWRKFKSQCESVIVCRA